jgi:hypothetical protein
MYNAVGIGGCEPPQPHRSQAKSSPNQLHENQIGIWPAVGSLSVDRVQHAGRNISCWPPSGPKFGPTIRGFTPRKFKLSLDRSGADLQDIIDAVQAAKDSILDPDDQLEHAGSRTLRVLEPRAKEAMLLELAAPQCPAPAGPSAVSATLTWKHSGSRRLPGSAERYFVGAGFWRAVVGGTMPFSRR